MGRFVINANGFSRIEREHIKRSILSQGMRQGVRARVITVDGSLEITTSAANPLSAIAYEAAICNWFGIKSNVKP